MKSNTFIKIIAYSPVVLIAAIFLLYTVCPIINDHVAKGVVKELKKNPLPEKTVIVDEASAAGKLCGCGNGMEYFGALLLKSELSLEELEEYYSQFSDKKCKNIVEQQCECEIKEIEHQDVSFKTEIDGDDYFILYTWGDYDGLSSEFDLRGH